MADKSLLASASPRQLKPAKSAELNTGVGKDSSIAAIALQRPSPESDTRPPNYSKLGLDNKAIAVKFNSQFNWYDKARH